MTAEMSRLRALVGFGFNRTGHLEKWVSGLGGLVGILAVLAVSQGVLGLTAGAAVVASMGASAVLLFAVPHGPLSQPWAVVGGHLISALIGVSCVQWLGIGLLSAACAVALAIAAMHYARCIHPPGGATALTAVAGGEAIHNLGYGFVLTPVLLNALVILAIAVLFNWPFHWRRYPAALVQAGPAPAAEPDRDAAREAFSRADLAEAIQAMDTTLDIDEGRLEALYHLARRRNEARSVAPGAIRVGAYYSNGEYGPQWQVRRVIDRAEPGTGGGSAELVIYKVVAGQDRRRTGTARLQDFAAWARHEVFLNENSWQRVEPRPAPSTTREESAA